MVENTSEKSARVRVGKRQAALQLPKCHTAPKSLLGATGSNTNTGEGSTWRRRLWRLRLHQLDRFLSPTDLPPEQKCDSGSPLVQQSCGCCVDVPFLNMP